MVKTRTVFDPGKKKQPLSHMVRARPVFDPGQKKQPVSHVCTHESRESNRSTGKENEARQKLCREKVALPLIKQYVKCERVVGS